MSFASRVDVAIVGAGAAGLAAAQALSRKNLSVLILEATNRIGGRAFTRQLGAGIHFDAGCEWLHSADRNSLVKVAQSLGLELACNSPHWGEQSLALDFPASAQREFNGALSAFDRRVNAAAKLPNDGAAAGCLVSGNRWNHLIDAVSTYVNGAELSEVSIHDTAGYLDTQMDWRVRIGYGALVASLGSQLRIALNTEVLSIDHSGREIVLKTTRGNLCALRALCTLPTDVITAEAVRFSPPLPDKIAAASGLPLGNAEKAMLYCDNPEDLPVDGHLFGATNRVRTGSYDLRPLGRPCIQAFFGGQLARELVQRDALIAFAIDELVGVLGSGMRSKLRAAGASSWAISPFSRGSYSHALVGYAGCRAQLASPHDDRLFFAGEATSPVFFSTAHGAYDSGLRAASEIVRSFDKREGSRLAVTSRAPRQGRKPLAAADVPAHH